MRTFLGTILSGSLSRPFVVLNAEDKLTRRVLLDHLSEDTVVIASIKATNDVTIEFFWTGQKTEVGDNAGSDKASGCPGRNEIGEVWLDYFVILTKNNCTLFRIWVWFSPTRVEMDIVVCLEGQVQWKLERTRPTCPIMSCSTVLRVWIIQVDLLSCLHRHDNSIMHVSECPATSQPSVFRTSSGSFMSFKIQLFIVQIVMFH